MNRRNLLKTALSIPVAGALNACKSEPPPPTPRTPEGTLRVILNGPFGVVLESADDYHRIVAYVPSDPQHQHELRFQGPAEVAGRESQNGKSPTYSFRLLPDGLDIGHGRPRIDQGFFDFNLPHIGEWKLPPDAFVAIELPRPDYITFTPPAQPESFSGKPTLQPLDHILEYQMSDPNKVRIKSGEKEYRPTPCSELLKQYQDYWSKNAGYAGNPEDSQRKAMEDTLRNCPSSDLCVLFGVGLDATKFTGSLDAHGRDFFNNVLLPSFAPGLKKPLQMLSTCAPSRGDMFSSPELVPAVLSYRDYSPQLLPVSSVLDCKAGGIMGTSP